MWKKYLRKGLRRSLRWGLRFALVFALAQFAATGYPAENLLPQAAAKILAVFAGGFAAGLLLDYATGNLKEEE